MMEAFDTDFNLSFGTRLVEFQTPGHNFKKMGTRVSYVLGIGAKVP